MRQAVESADRDWVDAELELLHNLPSLIGEANVERHKYFCSQERAHHVQWASAPGREQARARTLTYYKPLWDDMEPVLTRFIAQHASQHG
jgi:hypothetical protein